MTNPHVEGYCDPRFSAIEQHFTQAITSGFDTGASVAVEYQGEMVVNLWGGFKKQGSDDPWAEDTLVNVYSTTKAITATCILKLISEGKLDIDRPVSDYWPEYGCEGKENTKVSDFMCHRAAMHGFPGGVPQHDFRDWTAWTDTLAAQPPFRTPGTSQGYHALTYGWLVGEIIRRVDGRSVGQYVAEELAQPFGLDFKIGLEDADITRCADITQDSRPGGWVMTAIAMTPDFLLSEQLRKLKAFLRTDDFKVAFAMRSSDANEVNSDEWRKAEVPSANGHSTASALAKLFGILSTGCEREGKQLITPNTLDFGLQPLSEGPDTVLFNEAIRYGVGYDLGLGMTTIGGDKHPARIFGHCGIGGSVAFGDPEKGIGYAFLCNRMHKPRELYQTSNALTRAVFEITG